jgi:hypothetical protein
MVDLSVISEMVEPSVRSALEGYKRELREMDDEIESIQYYLTRAAPLGSESETFLDYKSQLQKATIGLVLSELAQPCRQQPPEDAFRVSSAIQHSTTCMSWNLNTKIYIHLILCRCE